MPTYDYACPACGNFDALRSLSQRDEAATCPQCGGASPRVFASAAPLALGSARGDTSAAPGYARLRHAAGCGCCRPRAPTLPR